MPPEAADKAIICAAGQASPWFVWCWSLVLIHWVLVWGHWLTYAGCQMMHIRQQSGVLNCTSIVTMSVQCGYLTRSNHKGAEYATDIFWFVLRMHPWCFAMCPLTCPLPLCIHGNSYLFGELPTSEQCLVISMYDNHCKAHKSKTVLFSIPLGVGMHLNCITECFLVWIL